MVLFARSLKGLLPRETAILFLLIQVALLFIREWLPLEAMARGGTLTSINLTSVPALVASRPQIILSPWPLTEWHLFPWMTSLRLGLSLLRKRIQSGKLSALVSAPRAPTEGPIVPPLTRSTTEVATFAPLVSLWRSSFCRASHPRTPRLTPRPITIRLPSPHP